MSDPETCPLCKHGISVEKSGDLEIFALYKLFVAAWLYRLSGTDCYRAGGILCTA